MTFILKIKAFVIKIIFSKIFLVFILSFLLRFYFIFNNYPFVFHPDEPTIINSTINLRYNLNPKHFDWPTTYYYLNYPLYNLYERFEGYSNRNNLGFSFGEIDYYLVTRTLTCIFGALNVVIIYFILRYLGKDDSNSLIGSVIYSLFSFHIARSALALADIPMLFFGSLSLMFLVRNLKQSSNWNFILACFFAGLSVSTKYNGYMIFLSIALYIFIIKKLSFKDIGLYFYCSVSSFLGFFIGTPYAILDWKTFSRSDSPKGALWQFENVGKVDFITQLKSFFINFYNISDLVNYLPILLSIGFIFYFFLRKKYSSPEDKVKLILIIQFLYIIWSVSGVSTQRSQYFILILPFIAIFSSLALELLKRGSLLLFGIYLILSFYNLIILSIERPITYLYRNLVVSGDRSKLNILYDDTDTKVVLDTLKIPSDKINELMPKPKDTHIISTTNLCESSSCSYQQLDLIESPLKKDKLYIYEIKQ